MLLFCLCGAVGQLFIFATIKRFGSLINTLVTTTRKFFNILLSGGCPTETTNNNETWLSAARANVPSLHHPQVACCRVG